MCIRDRFNSTQGTFSMRLSDGSLLITPYMKDRKYLEPEDIVRIKNGMCEADKRPSRSALLHQKVYAVSYTHLDVYKRQCLKKFCASFLWIL